jgi:hypothetical protein
VHQLIGRCGGAGRAHRFRRHLRLEGFGQWWFLFLALGLESVGVLLFTGGKAFSNSGSALGSFCYLLLRGGGAGFSLAWFVIGVSQTYQGYLAYRDLIHERAAGQEKFVQGVITKFSSYGSRPSSHPKESFMIDGKTFIFSPSEIRPGFNAAQKKGSLVQDGALARVGYIGDTISRLEICQSGNTP